MDQATDDTTIQKTLFGADGRTISYIPHVDIDLIEISQYNPRKNWDEKHVNRLAQLIENNGFDNAFAVKCHKEDDGLRCFAGSNRVKAARKAGEQFIPIFLYEGYEGREIWRMAYEDNEQADAQQQFNIVDVWLDYKAHKRNGMKPDEIVSALGVGKSTVYNRLNLADLPSVVLQKFSNNTNLTERHALELLEFPTVGIFNGEVMLCEIIDTVLERYKEPTSKQFKKEVQKYNAAIEAAKENADRLESPWKEQFIEKIQSNRNAASIANQGAIYLKKQQEAQEAALAAKIAELTEEEEKLKKQQAEVKKAEQIKKVTDWVIHGDSRIKCNNSPSGIKLIFTDPPYGQDFQSNRRTATAKAGKIKNDNDLKKALDITRSTLQAIDPKLKKDAALLMWCSWRHEPEFRQMVANEGWEIKNSIVWVKNNHGSGDLTGSFAPKHERLLFATKGNVKLNNRLPDVLTGGEFLTTDHPTPKPLGVIEKLIECLTLENDIVADPFMGCSSTGVGAIRSGRRFWGCDIEKQWWEEAMTNITNLIK
jgi:site-specific DNA-methyltransferase (adenine-specific)